MKLLEKLKNTFFEEEYVEEEVVEPKKEVVARKVEPKEVKREIKNITPVVEEIEDEEKIEVPEEKKEVYSDNELLKSDSKVPYFDDDDFLEKDFNAIIERDEPKKLYGGEASDLYDSISYSSQSAGSKPYSAPLKEAFKPTPIISPIYGVLDKNYRKEEVIDKKDKPSSYVSRRNADLDSVRMKAYGGLNPIEEINTPVSNVNADKKEVTRDEINDESNLLYDMTSDNSKPVVDQVTLADAEEYFEDLGLEYNIDYKDSRYEKATGRRTSVDTRKQIEDDVLPKESEEANLEDNLFDLIDSIYEEGDE